MRVYFGGSFDPVHDGHISMMRQVFITLQEHRVNFRLSFLPTAGNPLKGVPTVATHRLAMLNLACTLLANDGVQVDIDRTEIDSPPPNYTIDTVRALRARYDERIVLVMGADSLVDLPRWRDGLQIPKLADIWAFDRVSADVIDDEVRALMTEDVREFMAAQKPIYHDGTPIISISSTQVRTVIAQGGYSPHLPTAIHDYISAHGLYK